MEKFKKISIMKSEKIFLGILAGFAGGALMGMLFAPEKGPRTRKNITYLGDDYTDDLKAQFEGCINTLTKKYEKSLCDVELMLSLGKAKSYESNR